MKVQNPRWIACSIRHDIFIFVQFNSPLPHKACSNILIYFLIAGVITGSCVIMALLHTSPWKPSPYTLSRWKPTQQERTWLHICSSVHIKTSFQPKQKHLISPVNCCSLKTLSPYIHHLKTATRQLYSWNQSKSSVRFLSIHTSSQPWVCCFCSAWTNSLGPTSGQYGVSLAEGDPRLLGAWGSEKGLETFAQRAASSIIVLHCPVLDLLAKAYTISGYFTALTNQTWQKDTDICLKILTSLII